ncbi:TPA: hypothetical protein ACTUT5_000593 [Legionella anisa]|uniref:hypothetical protein n=1 Tax=Legionella anisa TaxID=28082 RepID=UPI00197DD237|nr:hypothetical protein [Legionella anisa]MBN5934759.1 hypothetical protein [Legionella anisa]
MSNAVEAKKIIMKQLQEFMHHIEIVDLPFQFKNDDGDLLSFELSEIKVCLNQMEDELSVISAEPYDYLQWSISVPYAEANGGRYFNVRKIDLIEAIINYCFGRSTCEGSLKPGVVVSENHVAGAVYIYKNGIDKIVVGVKESFQIAEDKETSTIVHPIETRHEQYASFNTTTDTQLPIEENATHSTVKKEDEVIALADVDTKITAFQDGSESNDKTSHLKVEAPGLNDSEELQRNIIRKSALTAIANYLDWSEKGNKHRGANGWFTWFRHWQSGRDRAYDLQRSLQKNPSLEDIQIIINGFLQNKKTHFNQHSLASFLLDELSVIEDSPWQDTSQYPEYKVYEETESTRCCWPF